MDMDELSKLFTKTRCLEIIENTRPGPALDASEDADSEDGTGDRDLREGTVRDRSLRDRLIGDARLILAPLCGVTDAVFRRICLDRGADMVVSEMISSEGLVRNSLHIRAIRNLDMSAGPLVLQIFGADPGDNGRCRRNSIPATPTAYRPQFWLPRSEDRQPERRFGGAQGPALARRDLPARCRKKHGARIGQDPRRVG